MATADAYNKVSGRQDPSEKVAVWEVQACASILTEAKLVYKQRRYPSALSTTSVGGEERTLNRRAT